VAVVAAGVLLRVPVVLVAVVPVVRVLAWRVLLILVVVVVPEGLRRRALVVQGL
jgi:hypothetical protein